MAEPRPSIHFTVDDGDLDDAELWAVIDSAVAVASNSSSRSRKPLSALKISTSNPTNVISNNFVSPLVIKNTDKNPRFKNSRVEDVRISPDGEVVQEERCGDCRPAKMVRFVDPGPGDGRKMLVVRRPQQSPNMSFPSPYSSPEGGRMPVQQMGLVTETSPQTLWLGENREGDSRHSLSGQFPSVSLFKQYQNAAMAVLEKSDYTMIRGSPFIKKSGWRKISFFFNLSFEIKDKTIELDENHNVLRAEFVVRAFMHSGRFADGWGSCDRSEKKFMKPNHDIPSTAETRAKNKSCQDLLGIGEYQPGMSNMVR